MPLIASNQAETPDLILRNHSSVRISHRSLKLTILRIFLMLVKSLKQWAHWVAERTVQLLRCCTQLTRIQHLRITPKRSEGKYICTIITYDSSVRSVSEQSEFARTKPENHRRWFRPSNGVFFFSLVRFFTFCPQQKEKKWTLLNIYNKN